MDPFSVLGVAASIISCMHLTGALLKRVGPSDHGKKALTRTLAVLCGFRGAYEGLKLHLEVSEEDEARLSALQHLEAPLRDCKQALDNIEERVKNLNFVGQYLVGTFWDRKLEKWLRSLEDAKALFELALNADQHIILSAVERYVRNIGEDVRDIHMKVNENGMRLLEVDDHTREHYEQAKTWHMEARGGISVMSDGISAYEQAAERRYQGTNDNFCRLERKLSDHDKNWKCKVEGRDKDQVRVRILNWLSCTDPSVNHNAARKKHQPETGDWFTQGEEYIRWREIRSSFLWLHGIPGCGKTILCSSIIENTRSYCGNRSGHTIAYFYFSFNDAEKQNVLNFLRSILSQLARQRPEIPESIQSLYNSYQHGQPPVDALKTALRLTLDEGKETFLIADALDECPNNGDERMELLALLTEFSTRPIPNLHIIVTSRKEPDITQAMSPLATILPISIRGRQVDNDVRLYVKVELAKDPRLKKWSQQIKEDIENTLVEGANGMFRWVYCQLESLKRCLKATAVRKVLSSLPKTLGDTYDRILLGIDPEYVHEAVTALRWLCFSQRPLLVEELAEAVAINPTANAHFDPEERLADPCYILQILSSLVVLSTRDPTLRDETNSKTIKEVKLAHFSIREYLISEQVSAGPAKMFGTTGPAAHHFIAASCLHYMRIYDRADVKYPSQSDLIEFPLLWYACSFWYAHAGCSGGALEKSLSVLICKFMVSPSWLSAWLRVLRPDYPAYLAFQVPAPQAPPLYYSSLLGFHDAMKALITNGADVNAHGGYFGNALQAASLDGHAHAVQMLIENGADVNAQGGYHGNALQAASKAGHAHIVQGLVENGADVNAQGRGYDNALKAASSQGHIRIVQELIKRGADVNAQSGWRGNALRSASEAGHAHVVQVLVENGADVNARGEDYDSALQAASRRGHIQTAQELIKRGADINAKGGWCGNALQVASLEGHAHLVRMLIENRADVNAQGGYHGNALQAASGAGHVHVVQVLIENGTDVNAEGGHHGNALQAASNGGHIRIVQVLIENGADVNVQGGHHGNALQAASNRGHIRIVQVLTENGADVNAQGGHHGNALQAASSEGCIRIVQELIKKGADVNSQGGWCGNALQAASRTTHDHVVKLLIENGADVNAQGGYYGNALQAASRAGHVHVVQELIKGGADVNAQGGWRGNALRAASEARQAHVVRLLVENGADVNAQREEYGSALQAASEVGHADVVQILVENGADVNAQWGHHGNALQAASRAGHVRVVQVLVENGADVNAQGGHYGNTLQAASSRGHIQIVRELIKRGTGGGWRGNALQAASEGGHVHVVQMLIENGADVNSQGGHHGNALQAASKAGHVHVVQELIKRGAEVNTQGGWHGNALRAASEAGYAHVVRLLIENGADVNAQREDYGSALQAAPDAGHAHVVQMLVENGAEIDA